MGFTSLLGEGHGFMFVEVFQRLSMIDGIEVPLFSYLFDSRFGDY
jgi:hypothetical protein